MHDSNTRAAARFAATRWSLVLAARAAPDPASRQALGELCRIYWYPLFAFARRRGLNEHDAADGVQGFFESLIEREGLSRVDASRGRFRSFLLASFRHHLDDERDRANAGKRGGGRKIVAFDETAAEARFASGAGSAAEAPERSFDREYAIALLAEVVAGLRAAYESKHRADLFDLLKPALAGGALDYAALAAKHGTSEGSLRVAVHRLRERFRDAVRRHVAETLAPGEDVDSEIAALLASLSRTDSR